MSSEARSTHGRSGLKGTMARSIGYSYSRMMARVFSSSMGVSQVVISSRPVLTWVSPGAW